MSLDHRLVNESLFTQAFKYAPIGMALVDLDGGVLKSNPAICTILGYPEAELNTMTFQEITHPEDLELDNHHLVELLAFQRDSYQLEKRYFHKDGHIIWALLAVSLVVDEDNTPQFFISQIINLTDQKHVENRLKENERLLHGKDLMFRSIVNQSFDFITIHSPEGIYLEVSASCQAVLGYTPEEMIGQSGLAFIHPDDYATALQDYQKVVQTGKFSNLTYRIRKKDGEYLHLEAAGITVTDADTGKLNEIIIVTRDITERMQMMAKLEEAQALSLLISDNALDIITFATPDCITRYISPAVRRLLGYEPEEMIGTTMTDLWHPDDLEGFLKRGLFKDGDVDMFECRVRHQQGHYVWFETTVKMICDEQGTLSQVIGVGRDITLRKKAENELRATKEKLESFINHNVDPVMMINTECDVVKINFAFEATFGWTSQEIVGINVFDFPFIPDKSRPGCVEALKQLQPYCLETVRKKKNGDDLPVMISFFTIQDEAGKPNGWALTLRDLTTYKQAEELLINSEKLSIAGQLAAGIAHEIRNPITAIKGFMQLLRSGRTEKPMYFDIISSEIERIEMILSELLILAKPQLIHTERKDIQILLRQVTTLLESQANMNNVQVETEFEPCAIYVLGDENQLKQVCINFIKNAIEAMPHGGKIQIQLIRTNVATILLRFIDQGCGIPEHILAKLGQPFLTTKETGTGLGFMVSKKIIENHNGTIKVSSVENEGTTIEVCLPAAK
ncbi:PAS domain S-box protein [Paenibacillus alba]|uniref:PAS domain S-box protein n=1 Tax=Paenibacillus alba TaxID=1197127 RepID=UPI001566CFC4|nr:PAS domain S-box protein [Paenibacillus alba]NQX70945.1 PAS domain S-box protein [Paenibacillus alba]